MNRLAIPVSLVIASLLFACNPTPTTTPEIEVATLVNEIATKTRPIALTAGPTQTVTEMVALTPVLATPTAPSVTPDTRRLPKDWQKWPVVPQVSDKMLAVYAQGLQMGNNPASFIKIGDCESTPTWFLGDFDEPDYQIAVDYTSLQPLLDQFQGSFGRTSVAAKSSFSAASVLSPFWADPQQCEKGETPLDCELRIMNPSISLVTLGTNDVWDEVKFEKNLRQIIEQLLAAGVVPVLATKADNLEGDHAINAVIAKLAYEYDLPLWNFWLALQDLPDKGLQEDKAHLTWGPNRFDDLKVMKRAWPIRNLTALQVLQAVWESAARNP